MTDILRACEIHGISVHALRKGGRYRCRACAVDAVRKRRRKVKKLAVDHKGGKCCVCGYDKCVDALEFHHLDEEVKEFGISDKGYTRAWNKVRTELDKCVLVCANCHREIHAGLVKLAP